MQAMASGFSKLVGLRQSFATFLMEEALQEAKKGLVKGEVPVGAVLATLEGQIVAKAHNRPVSLSDPTAHAEILAMRDGAAKLGNYRLNDMILAVTLEPCIMCMGTAIHARIARLVFGAPDPKNGAAGSVFDFAGSKHLNHRIEIDSGIMERECRALIQSFFQVRRKKV